MGRNYGDREIDNGLFAHEWYVYEWQRDDSEEEGGYWNPVKGPFPSERAAQDWSNDTSPEMLNLLLGRPDW